MKTTLYFVAGDDEDGHDRDLFVEATTPQEAISLWKEHYWGGTDGEPDDPRVFIVPAPCGESRVRPWFEDTKIG